jgi:hypothetical protein
MTDQDNHAALWAAIAVLGIAVMLLALVGCAAQHEFCVEANRDGEVVAVYRVRN